MSEAVASGGVVVGVDGSPQSSQALDWAIETAQLERRSLHLVHAHGTGSESVVEGESLLQSAVQRVGTLDPTLRVTSANVQGSGKSALLAASGQAALLVVGTHGRGHLVTRVLGSTALALVNAAACAVAVVTPPTMARERPRRVVVGVDESAGCHDAIGFAFSQADLRHLRLTAVHAWRASDRIGLLGAITQADKWRTAVGNEEAAMAESLAGWSEKYPDVELSRVSIRTEPAAAILAASDVAALVVLGSRRAGALSEAVGSPIVHTVLRGATCPVVVVPEDAV
jgi:nucleotide-binding universal stress UspA family protein